MKIFRNDRGLEQRLREDWESRNKEGSALVAALMLVSMLAMLGLSMLSAGMSGSRTVTGQAEEYRLTSAVESVGILSAESLWSGYLRQQGGSAGTIDTFRNYLTTSGIADAGPGGPPQATAGVDLLATAGIPGAENNNPQFDNVNVDSLRVVRRDEEDATRLYITVSASTDCGKGLVTKPMNRAVQLVYTIEPAAFEGFDYGILAKNVNCVFCHTVVDSADRVYNLNPALVGTFDKVKVGTLESLMLRFSIRAGIDDFDADSSVAGTLYVRGKATNQNGVPITNWGTNTAGSCKFDTEGNLVQDEWGNLDPEHFVPAGDPPGAGANLYLDYPTDYSAMPDGKLPTSFPSPFPDNGGIDPGTGMPSSVGANNRTVDPNEFYAAAQNAEGSVASGIINVTDSGTVIGTSSDLNAALTTGNASSLASVTHGNVVLHGTEANPIVLNGTVAIDGDVVITGYIKGTGTILASGNVYVPNDLHYFDGRVYLEGDTPGVPTGPVTFGIAQDGTKNALGLAAGGNLMIGDFLMPRPSLEPEDGVFISGDPSGPFNFALSELCLFNRGEWAHTQPFLPGPGQDHLDPSTWTVANPDYRGPDYVPRYYNFGPGDEIPIYNLGNLYFDSATGTWKGDAEVPLDWNSAQITLLDPDDHTNPLLYDQVTGEAKATVMQLTPNDGWIADDAMKSVIDAFEAARAEGSPLQIDGLLYTNNAIFGIVNRNSKMKGQLLVNGSLVCADLGLLAPGYRNPGGATNVPGSPFAAGLRLNYDRRTKNMLNVVNPYSVTIRRTLWNPTANVL